jgi:CubicO group peptidase (beta-lactamase class C family)
VPCQTRRQHVLGLACFGGAGCASTVRTNPFVGTWSGLFESPSRRMRMVLEITDEGQGSMQSIDQGSTVYPATRLSFMAGQAIIEFGQYDERLDARLVGNVLRITSVVWAQTVDFVRGDQFPRLTSEVLTTLRLASGAPALAAAFARSGLPAVVLADGMRSTTADVPVTSSDRWRLGSLTKSMTATLAARIVEAGHIGWDTALGDVLRVTADTPQQYRSATLMHLLSHHAGLPREIDAAELATFATRFQPGERLRYVQTALRQPPVALLGERMNYSNSGYIIAAAVLESVAGMTWEELMGAHVFDPLGLSTAGFGPPGTKGNIDQPLGHYRTGSAGDFIPALPDMETPVDIPAVQGPSGGIHMGLSDFVSFLQVHLDRPSTFLSSDTWARLHTPPFTLNYALGWSVGDAGRLYHAGSTYRWCAEASIDRSSGVVAVAAANAQNEAIRRVITETLTAARRRGEKT